MQIEAKPGFHSGGGKQAEPYKTGWNPSAPKRVQNCEIAGFWGDFWPCLGACKISVA